MEHYNLVIMFKKNSKPSVPAPGLLFQPITFQQTGECPFFGILPSEA